MRIAFVVAPLLMVPAVAAAADRQVTIAAGTPISLETAVELTSNNVVMGSLVRFRVASDVQIDGVVVIAKGTEATGQVTDARERGAMGMSGKLSIRPLYLRAGRAIVRLKGSVNRNMGVSAGGAASMVFNPLFFTGRNAVIPAGTAVPAEVEKAVMVSVAG
jgi:hypothetical protein